MRRKLYEIIEPSKNRNVPSLVYDYFMMVVIVLSILPLCFKQTNIVFRSIDAFCFVVFVLDYLLRWVTADYRYDKSWYYFILYPFGFFDIIDFV